jgi:superfamily II DNA or RNA helicase
MPLFEIPSSDGYSSDVVFVRDQNNPDDPVYTHYAFTRGASSNPNEIRQRRGIPFNNFRSWKWFCEEFPEIAKCLDDSEEYCPGESVLNASEMDENFHVNTVMRLGAIEILANIFSGRITANDKDPFPHQLALQQYFKGNVNRVKRVLIADEVGLGKTIEIGLVLRDLLIAKGGLENFSCLYLTKAGLLEDACSKLQAVMKGAIDGQNIIQSVSSFTEYGKNSISGIHVASMDAARLYVEEQKKKKLPSDFPVSPEILIIDECHYCASDEDLSSPQKIKNATQTYKAAYQMITGSFWSNSTPPALVVLMSATPFRSKIQFVNLLRLLTHESTVENAFLNTNEKELVDKLSTDDSSSAIIWRQQSDVKSWSEQPLFPMLNVERVRLNTNPEYLNIIKEICKSVQRICRDHTKTFGGFATRHLETRLTSSSIAGAIWLFRWCVKHQTWKNQATYGQDTSTGTDNLRRLIIEISQRLAEYDEKNTSKHADVNFSSDGFQFRAVSLTRGGKIDDIYRFSESIHRKDEVEEGFTATPNEIIELSCLALKLLNFSSLSQIPEGVENAKLNWLKENLDKYPDSKFLVFTETLQTCEIITKALPGISDKLIGGMGNNEREKIVRRFRNVDKPNIRVLVATSAADEGFDFQVANRIVHWDLSSSPAVLMQRNGRVARLGQISDVNAYYLIMVGTHEERREMALHQRFSDLGIEDEQLRLRILGSLTEEIESQILAAVQDNQLQVVNKILENANEQNQDMNQRLGELQKDIEAQSVIDRTKLCDRLKYWLQLGLPAREQNEFHISFDETEWERPVFAIGKETTMKIDNASIASIQRGDRRKKATKVTFDPEFSLFSTNGDQYSLAGLRPWIQRSRRSQESEIWSHRPMKDVDPIGELACSIARQRGADFTVVDSNALRTVMPSLSKINYLLFATHPLLEVEENSISGGLSSYLTFYAFGEDLSAPINEKGYSANEVNQIICLLELEAKKAYFTLDDQQRKTACIASKEIAIWLNSSRVLPKRGQNTYFLPIPIALVAVIS